MALLLDGNSGIGARKEKSLFFEQVKAFDLIKNSDKIDFFSKRTNFLHVCATCSKLPPNIRTMDYTETQKNRRKLNTKY